MKRLMCAAFAAALLLPGAFAVSARAHDEGGAHGGRPGMAGKMGQNVKEKLGLTDDQAAKFETSMKAHQDAMKPIMRKMRDGMTKLGDQLADKASDSDIRATLDSLKSARKDQNDEQEKFHAALASFLTPTQQAKLLIGMMKHMHEGMMGRGGEHRMGGRGEGRGGDHPAPKDEEHGEEHGE